MLATVIEEGPESFVARWRRFAADAVLFARPEGSPLLEAAVAGTVLQLLERTNPYLATPGPARLVVAPVADVLEPCDDDGSRLLEVPERGTLRGRGPVLERDGRVVAIDVGAPLVVALDAAYEGPLPEVGDRVRFEARAPVHGFVLPRDRGGPVGPNGRGIDDAP